MALLKVFCGRHNRVEEEVDVPGATSMHYAAMHVAEAMGYDCESEQRFYLFDAKGGGISSDDIAAHWDGCIVTLGAANS